MCISSSPSSQLESAGGKMCGRAITIMRSVQRLALILGVEEQTQPMIVIEDHSHVIITAGDEDNTAGD